MTRSKAFAVSAAAALIAELYVLAWYAPARVTSEGRHLAPIEEFAQAARVRQVFVASDDGLDRIEVLMHASRATDALVTWTLERVRSADVVETVAAGRRRLVLKKGESWQNFPIATDVAPASGRYAFSLTLDRSSVSPDARVAAVNVLDNPLRNGYVSVDGAPRWGDLGLRAHARAETVAGRFMLKVVPGLRPPFNYGAVWIGVLAALNVLAAVTVREVLV